MPFSRLQTDRPLPDDACWFRFVTNSDHITRDQTLHYQALKGAQFSPSDPGKPRQHELSGAVVGKPDSADQIRARGEARLRSIRDGYAKRGQQTPSKIRFMGVACAAASKLRFELDGVVTNTAYTPEQANPAHSDIITFNSTTDASIDPVRHRLIKILRIVVPTNIDQIVT